MIFKQIHNLPTGHNWDKIILLSLVAIGATALFISIKNNNSGIKKIKVNKPKE